jgi:putative ATP-dependent endonuclease of the OLD family
MEIKNIKINNFRLLKDVEININETTTAIVGKNNTGKTSFSKLIDIFINDKNFSFDDFSLKTHRIFKRILYVYQKINVNNKEKILTWLQNVIPKISLLIELKISSSDTWSNIKPFHIGLDSTDTIKLLFEFGPENTEKFLETVNNEINELKTESKTVDIIDIYKMLILVFYKQTIRPYSETEFTDTVSLTEVQNLLQCSFIYAQRAVDDSHSNQNSKLSSVFENQYKKKNKEDKKNQFSKNLIDTVDSTSKEIDKKLKDFFEEFLDSFSLFGFPNVNKEELILKSELKVEKLFKNDVKLFYKKGEKSLPESYNGLGYSNLIYIISKIIGFREIYNKSKANLCLVFIEEPEAHMHPQMQSIFIKNINIFLEKQGFNVQVILTTHSSHILANADFNSIRYFTTKNRCTIAKDLMTFSPSIDRDETLAFLKQYLTLGKADLFFADKAILFEGVVERLLMPLFIRKIDRKDGVNLSEEYISFIEVGGAYINKFKELLEFLELKALMITDIDCVKKVIKPDKNGVDRTSYPKAEICDNDDLLSCNTTLVKWIPGEVKIKKLLLKTDADKQVDNIRVAYQTNVSSTGIKCGRSFEEAFIIENHQYIFDNNDKFYSIKKHLKHYPTKEEIYNKSYKIHSFIDRNKKKTDFAFDILTIKSDDWNTPVYIKEGLKWLAL